MAVIYRHWKLAFLNVLLVVITILAIVIYFVKAPVPKAHADQGSSGSGTSITLDATGYGRIIKLRNKLCATDIDLVALGCSQSQVSNILSGLLTWYQSNASAWDTIDQQKANAFQQLTSAHQSITGAGNATLWQQMAQAHDQIAAADDSLTQLMQTASSVIASQLSDSQKSFWSTIQTNVAMGVPPRYRFTPSITARQASALAAAAAKHKTNIGSLLTSDQVQMTQTVTQTVMQNATAMFALDQSIMPMPASATTLPSGVHYNMHAQ